MLELLWFIRTPTFPTRNMIFDLIVVILCYIRVEGYPPRSHSKKHRSSYSLSLWRNDTFSTDDDDEEGIGPRTTYRDYMYKVF